MNDRKPGDRASDAGRTDLYDTTVREARQRCLEPFEALERVGIGDLKKCVATARKLTHPGGG
jgi:hypothetical protein